MGLIRCICQQAEMTIEDVSSTHFASKHIAPALCMFLLRSVRAKHASSDKSESKLCEFVRLPCEFLDTCGRGFLSFLKLRVQY